MKMGNPTNGPAAVTWLNIFCPGGYHACMCGLVTSCDMRAHLVTSGQTWSQMVSMVTVDVKDLDIMYNLVTLNVNGHRWSEVVTYKAKDLNNYGLDCLV